MIDTALPQRVVTSHDTSITSNQCSRWSIRKRAILSHAYIATISCWHTLYKPANGVACVVSRTLKMWARSSENISRVDKADKLDMSDLTAQYLIKPVTARPPDCADPRLLRLRWTTVHIAHPRREQQSGKSAYHGRREERPDWTGRESV
jgi:hypothetical protein